MKILSKVIKLQTKEALDFVDITDKVRDFIKESKVKDGLVNVQTLHTTVAVLVNENEPLLIEDFKDNLRKTAPKDLKYRHNNLEERTVNLCPDECGNGHSHCQAIHLSVSATLNLIKEELQLGQWQRIFLVELDRPRERKFQVQIIGV
jgi:secondary thiamine-phosphate synthase enzyme